MRQSASGKETKSDKSITTKVSSSNTDLQPLFFPVSLFKLLVLSFATLGIYECYWFYKNWKMIKARQQTDIKPFWRAFFLVIYCHPCFKEIQRESDAHFNETSPSLTLLTIFYIILKVCWRLPSPYWDICFFSSLLLLPLQKMVNRLNADVAPDHDPNSRFSGWEITLAIIGGIVFMLGIIGSFVDK
jgi:hypothetical protein